MQATVDRLWAQDTTDAPWTARITTIVLATQAAQAVRQACEAARRMQEAEEFEARRRRCTQLASSVFDRAGEILCLLETTTRTTTALRDSVPRMPRAFDIGFHIAGDDRDASLILTVIEGYDTVKAVRCISTRRLGTDVTKHAETVPADELSDHTVGELVATLVEDFFGSSR